MRLLRSDTNAVKNDDTLDQTTPIVTLDNRVIDFAAVQNEVNGLLDYGSLKY
jgi:hypothetical protein